MNAIEGLHNKSVSICFFGGFVEGIRGWCFWANSFSFFVITFKSRYPGVSWWGLERLYLIRSQRFVSSIGSMEVPLSHTHLDFSMFIILDTNLCWEPYCDFICAGSFCN